MQRLPLKRARWWMITSRSCKNILKRRFTERLFSFVEGLFINLLSGNYSVQIFAHGFRLLFLKDFLVTSFCSFIGRRCVTLLYGLFFIERVRFFL
jgi:hypothetical protein